MGLNFFYSVKKIVAVILEDTKVVDDFGNQFQFVYGNKFLFRVQESWVLFYEDQIRKNESFQI